MLRDGGPNTTEFMASQSVAFGDGAHDRSQLRIMGVRHVREQVVFNLMIKATGEPADKARTSGEVGSRANLMRGPIIAFANSAELHPRRQMRNLENDRQHPAEDGVKEEERRDCP